MRLGPLFEARRDADELLDRFFGDSLRPLQTPSGDVPTDVFHTEDKLVIRMDLPGVDPSKVDVTVQDNVLLINGTRPFPFDAEKVRFVRRGTFYGDFTQRVVLGKSLNLDGINADFSGGVLELTIPYAEEIQPRKISIATNGEGSMQLGE